MAGHLCPSMACAMSGHGAATVGVWPQYGLNILAPPSPQEPDVSTSLPDLAETVRRVARQLTALSDELNEAAGPQPGGPPVASLLIPPGKGLSAVRLAEFQRELDAVTDGMRLPFRTVALPPLSPVDGPSEPDVRNYGLKERNT